ncbi:MAG: preprotein translocase subunit SecA [Candidatus Kerfeldbacteria bacterium RIFCSPHIGHO2_02_FULL_42_14]|uniref:Protein translocase subunit SecA n=1 Tax=Candidatus Kerfeldbacteria bacterium RIFCSPHIGHO2_02_FULL_42_14 TaxID=1798540 RepID=A0A1G2AP37_9BACT|nr:MAG: preprotein translocase subunit SecA [Candidatus Kerfeldbacteria bacterium RIFCSPHIGHO2_02_FULL_42_14]OGY81049.1 MAG: preprotein translocase subunit SecA [Candidatus Kerfeldbacteria bacterium RIFCSPHIGHO2_12_FULL_42_13]OGY84867.1 MAG: preprotein translocase subunit SecA [Candidatus Kerfeldbacteria bacterium RIFCSPLOWO2_02_FULL_42_19]OGY86780.1 MAG: preprotein translocase subunit SecA [Candidatus Kerfeldbacteria bacterium RIFCSPLOWO2_12_FULL_43_9]
MKILEKIFGDPNVKILKHYQKRVGRINAIEHNIKMLSDDALKQQTKILRERLDKGETLDAVLDIAFATVREAAQRTLGQRHYDVQLMAGMALHEGKIAEMKTGEGKTLAATLSLYLNALSSQGAHLVTVNDYLARRDADWMGRIFYALGMTVGCIQHEAAFIFDPKIEQEETKEAITKLSFKVDMQNLRSVGRREAYNADITYGTNNEFGFDYLRDNMVQESSQKVQRSLHFAIIDEVDSILIDEARTPLIISAPAQEATERYHTFAHIVSQLKENEDYNMDEKMRAVALTQSGIDRVERMLGKKNMYQEGSVEDIHHIEQALKANALFKKDRDYVVREGEVVIVDEFTGRLMFGRRFSEGLHQAIEAKEGLTIKQESLTLATITLQNLFRLYKKLAGMTGTAATEAEEFAKIYGLDVVVVPTNRPMIRIDAADRIYRTERGKSKAVVQEIKKLYENGQPVLVGTISIEKNERLSAMLKKEGIPHNLLNAKNHEHEAEIIAQAGKLHAVTVATNMAGRGVDIVLSGNPPNASEAEKIKQLGGLTVLGTERHESRRIDNQLRGRSGRQGDAGKSQFYISLEDDLMRIFASERLKSLMTRLGQPEDMPLENSLITRSIEAAQKKVEGRNFDIRKHLVEYDDVMNKHREVIYKKRNEILYDYEHEPKKLRERTFEMIENEIEQVVSFHTAIDKTQERTKNNGMSKAQERNTSTSWDMQEIEEVMSTIFLLSEEEKKYIRGLQPQSATNEVHILRDQVIQVLIQWASQRYEKLESSVGEPQLMRRIEKSVWLRAIDMLWIDHLDQMTRLREGIGLRGYGQKDPLVEYQKEAYDHFTELMNTIARQVAHTIFKVGAQSVMTSTLMQKRQQEIAPSKVFSEETRQFGGLLQPQETRNTQNVVLKKIKDASGQKVGRNDLCPCGSGKKLKRCHGA